MNNLTKPVTFLISEFIVIVLGVLTALAIDSWQTSQAEAETREHLIEALIVDLREDSGDYAGFQSGLENRITAAKLILSEFGIEEHRVDSPTMTAGAALFQLGISSLLETVVSTYNEIVSTGSGSSIKDIDLRIRISKYYALASDRSDVNAGIYANIERYRIALEDLGYSPIDGENIDLNIILDSPRIMAIIRTMLATDSSAIEMISDLVEENRSLIEELERVQNAN